MRNFKKFLALVLAMMMVVGGMVTVSAAEEAAKVDYTAAAEALADLGIVKGTSDDVIDFALEDKVVRYQMALLVARIMTGEVDDTYWNKVVENTTPFDDVTKYYGAIAYVANNEIVEGKGWIPGVGDNCFDPEGPITYEQALTMAVRTLGYKQLVYPTGFVNTAKELGLTDGLEELAGDTQLTRGQMFQIIYNLLFTAGKDGKDFAEKAFGLQTASYVVVATENQALAGAKRVYRVDDYTTQSKWSKYVALAPINKDGSYNLDAIIHLTEGELGMKFQESEYRLGYSYTVQSFDGFKTAYNAFQNDTKTFQNYGDAKAEITAGTKYHGQADKLIKLDGITYKLVEAYTDLNNKDSYANRQPELIVHSMFEGETVAEITNLYYDAAGNVIDTANGEILIHYNPANGVYYVKSGNYFRVATDADFVAAATKIAPQVAQYGIVTETAKLINDLAFCEITLFDDNNDGAWDRGLYIPYSIGKYTTSDAKVFDVNISATTSDKVAVGAINGTNLSAYVQKADQSWSTTPVVIRQDNINFIGAGRPAKNQYIVYYYNPQGRVLNVIEKTSVKTAKVTAINQGTYSYDSKIDNEAGTKGAYYWKNATVTLEGESAPLVMGYRDYVSNKQYGKDLLTIDAELARYGYKTAVYTALLNNSFMNLEYVVLGGRVVYAAAKDTRTVAGQWIAFDYGSETINANTGANGYTTYGYQGDIIGVDADGNILVNAYVQGKKDQVVAAIGSINGFDTFGELVADYAALNFGFSGIGILGNEQYETMQKIVIRRFFDTLAKDLGVDEEGNEIRQLMYVVDSVKDGVYNIYTDIDVYWGADANPWRQPTANYVLGKITSIVTFRNGVADGKFGDYIPHFNKDTRVIVIGKDGIKTATGIPEDGAKFNFRDTGAGVYALSDALWVLVAPNAKCEDVYVNGPFDDKTSALGYTYYLVTGNATSGNLAGNSSATVTWDANGVGTYKYTMFNLNTGKTATVTVVGGLPYFTTNAKFDYNVDKPIGAIYAEKNGEWTLVNEVVEGTVAEGNIITKVKYAPEARQDVKDILYNGKTNFAPVFANRGISQGTPYLESGTATNTGLTWSYMNDEGTIVNLYATFALAAPDQYYFEYDANGVLMKATVSDGSAALSHAAFQNKTLVDGTPGYMYFNYDAVAKTFQSAYVYGAGLSAKELAAKAEDAAKALEAKKAAAKAEVKGYLFDYTTVAKYEAAFAAIDAAATADAVDKIVADYKAEIDADKATIDKANADKEAADKEAADAEAKKWADLKAEYDAIAADATTYASAPCATYTIEAVYTSWYAEVVAKRNYDEAVKTLEALKGAIADAAEAARPAYVASADAKSVVVTNIVDGKTATKFNSLTIYKKVGEKYEAVGTWTPASIITITFTPGSKLEFNPAIKTDDVKINMAYDGERTITLSFSHFDGMEWIDGFLVEGETYGIEFNLATGKTLLKDITIG